MACVYIIKDRTDFNFSKPFMAIHKSESSAWESVNVMRSKLPGYAHGLISVDFMEVPDFDNTSNNIYYITDKTNTPSKAYVAMFSKKENAQADVMQRQKTLAKYAHKYVSIHEADIFE